MNTLYFINEAEYRQGIQKILANSFASYGKVCYVSLRDPHHVILEMIKQVTDDEQRFILVDATNNIIELPPPGKSTYVLPTNSLFEMYRFIIDVVIKENISALLLDSVSALINSYEPIELKKVLADTLLEAGKYGCDVVLVAQHTHASHSVITHLDPLVAGNFLM